MMQLSTTTSHNATSNTNSFRRRQFAPAVTWPQTVFDVMFGLILPVACFVFDPIVFSDNEFSLFSVKYRVLAYCFSSLAILSLSIWLVAGRFNAKLNGFLAGALSMGATVSLLIGIVLLPLTFEGLMLVIGILGFIPFLTGFVYLRNCVRAFGSSQARFKDNNLVYVFLLGAMFLLGVTAVSTWYIRHTALQSIQAIEQGNFHPATEKLKFALWWTVSKKELRVIIDAYFTETDELKRAELDRAYYEITGCTIAASVKGS